MRPIYSFEGWKNVSKAKIAYLCTECGAHSVKWAGQCPDCSAWNTLTETTFSPPKSAPGAVAMTLDKLPDDIEFRHATGFGEFDRVLGGGLVPGRLCFSAVTRGLANRRFCSRSLRD